MFRRLLLAAFVLATPPAIAQQPTSRDTAHYKSIDSLLYRRFKEEANRPGNLAPRKTIINRLADSLLLGGKALIKGATTPPPTPAAPVANFTVACDTTGTFQCRFDGSGSTPIGKVTFSWDCGAFPNCMSTAAVFNFTYPHEGPRTAVLTVRDSSGRTSQATKTFTIIKPSTPPLPDSQPPQPLPPGDTGSVVLPEVPRSIPDASPKSCMRVVDVPIVAELQTYMNNAQGGDCLELQPGSEYKGNFKTPVRSCTATTPWITIRTRGTVDAPGTRMLPLGSLAKITQAYNQYALSLGHPSCNWQIMHLNIQTDAAYTGIIYHLLLLGDGGWIAGGDENASLATQPHDIIVRRNWIHGQANSQLVRCVAANGIRIAIVDNWIDDCHVKGFDAQAIATWNGAGPLLIRNNFLAGSGENFIAGGADPASPDLTPSDITITQNHFWKDTTWKGGIYTVKNLIELKSPRRVLIEANVFERVWSDAQEGMAINIQSVTDNPAIFTQTTDVTFRYNRVRWANTCFLLAARGWNNAAQPLSRISIEQNLCTDIGGDQTHRATTFGGDIRDLRFVHNTIVKVPTIAGTAHTLDGTGAQRADVRDNIVGSGAPYGCTFISGGATDAAAWNQWAGSTWRFVGNICWANPNGVGTPAGNYWPATQTNVGFTADWSLVSGSAYKGKASDGTDPGVNVAALNAKLQNVVISSGLTARPRSARIQRPMVITRADSLWLAHQPQGDRPR